MLASLLAGATYSFTVHGPDEFDRPRAIGLGEKIRRAAFVIGISSFTRSQLFRWIDSSHWDKIHVVHCGLEREFHSGISAPASEARRLVCVGRLGEQKGHLLLLAAMRLAFDRGCAFELVLAGDGELRAAIEARVRALALDGHVRITGWIASAEVRRELESARALALPSFAEGLPVVIMEAMALRRPVVTTCVAGIPELVRPGESGWLVPAGDVDALAAAIVACMEASPETLARMGAAARERVLERHDVDVEAAKLARLFDLQRGEHAH
jgi:glycosyltransferase involved in cell wall biosynthesis